MREPLTFAPRRRMAGLVRRPRSPADLQGSRRACESTSHALATLLARRTLRVAIAKRQRHHDNAEASHEHKRQPETTRYRVAQPRATERSAESTAKGSLHARNGAQRSEHVQPSLDSHSRGHQERNSGMRWVLVEVTRVTIFTV